MKASVLCCAAAAALFAPDAFAWGLQTHVFLAQWALAAAPLADPQVRAAARALPRLVLAGACLPDLAVAGLALGVRTFRRAHRWSTLRRLAASCWDEERAIAVGYASHLLADVVAHNRFVPEHERRILDLPHVTHALCEWAMDRHVAPRLTHEPAALLGGPDRAFLGQAMARTFRCGDRLALRAILFLARGEGALRASRLPVLCGRGLALLHGDRSAYFETYLAEARRLVGHVDAVLQGAEPRLQPEPSQPMSTDPRAMSAPSAPPAITSLG
jgi:hypothetical protein